MLRFAFDETTLLLTPVPIVIESSFVEGEEQLERPNRRC